MRLSDVISKEPSERYYQIDGFLSKKLKIGRQQKIDVGTVTLPFYCKKCEDMLTFSSINQNLTCISVNDYVVSIDTVLKCPRCESAVPVWFLVESDKTTMISQTPNVRVLKRTYKLSEKVSLNDEKYGKYSILMEKANRAYNDGLGSGSIVYLRKIYEQIVVETAKAASISTKTNKGKRKKFNDLLKEVDEKCKIVPEEFSQNGYKLFSELSNVIHGEYSEETAIKQYPAFYRLIKGILDKINNNKELIEAMNILKWYKEGEKEYV